MKNCILLSVLLLCTLFQLGCVSVDQRMQAYVGQHYSNVVATWGEPDSEIDNGEGGKLLTWQFVTTHTTPASVTTTTTHNTNSSSHTVRYDNNRGTLAPKLLISIITTLVIFPSSFRTSSSSIA